MAILSSRVLGSSFLFNKWRHTQGLTSFSPLWAQKFNRVVLDDGDSVDNAVDYVLRNREQHGLFKIGIQAIASDFLIDEDAAFDCTE